VASEHQRYSTSDLTNAFATKPFFKIGEVARLIGVKPHVLRYWESEFPSLRPKKNPSGQRIYAKADIDAIVEIQNLLYNERYTISGARQMLTRQGEKVPAKVPVNNTTVTQTLARLKDGIRELLTLLDQMPTL
jgi:DNA-binding transcriptional MerR regulator